MLLVCRKFRKCFEISLRVGATIQREKERENLLSFYILMGRVWRGGGYQEGKDEEQGGKGLEGRELMALQKRISVTEM